MDKLIQLLIAVVVFFLIFTYLIPMLTGIIHTVAVIVVVVAAIIFLLSLIGVGPCWFNRP